MLLVIVTLYLASYCCILVLPHDVDGSGPCRSNSIKERRWWIIACDFIFAFFLLKPNEKIVKKIQAHALWYRLCRWVN